MQSFSTKPDNFNELQTPRQTLIVGDGKELTPGCSATIDLPDGGELALFNIDGEFYATENFCPHKGAPLADGKLCGYVIECDWHGWQFDVRSGECLTARGQLEVYPVIIEDGLIRIEI